MTLVTIGIPFYNAEETLADAVRSVFAQTWQDWELILLDDGSTDGSLEIARAVADPRVRVISDGRNLGLPARLNQIAREAESEYIARMDADDLMSPVRIQREMEVLNRNPEIDLVSAGTFSLDESDRLIGVRCADVSRVTRADLAVWRVEIVHAALLGRKEWFLRNPYSGDYPLAEDRELWLRTALNGDLNLLLIQELLYYYRESSSCSSCRKVYRAYQSLLKLNRRYGPRLFDSRAAYIKSRLKLWFRAFAVTLICAAGAGRLRQLFRNRKKASAEYCTLFEKEMRTIKGTVVPGIDEPGASGDLDTRQNGTDTLNSR